MIPQVVADVWARVAFYPSLLHTVVMSKVGGRAWYTRIDDTVILGALPLKHKTKQLVENENVRGIVTLNEEYETKQFMFNSEEWSRLGVNQLWISTVDFVGVPHPGQIQQALQFIEEHKDRGCCVYVHCKAGRTRSTTLVACYLMQKNKWSPEKAVNFIKSKRPQIVLLKPHWSCLEQFYRTCS